MIVSAEWTEDRTIIKVTFDDGTVLWVPDDMANAHRQELAKWEAEAGNVIQPYVPPPEVKET